MTDRMRGNDIDELTHKSKCLGCPWGEENDDECRYTSRPGDCPWISGDEWP